MSTTTPVRESYPARITPFPTGSRLSGAEVPPARRPLIGRDREVATVAALLRDGDVRLLTITGPGGVGKTSLALHAVDAVADSFDAVAFVSLASVRDMEQVGNSAELLRLARALTPFWSLRSYRQEGSRWLERALSMTGAEGVSAEIRASALHGAASLARTHDLDRAMAFAEAALALYRTLDDVPSKAALVNLLGVLYRSRGAFARAEELLTEALTLVQQVDEPVWVALAYCNLGILAHWQRNPARATMLLDEALWRYRKLEEPWGIGIVLSDRALVTGDGGDSAGAAALHLESLSLLRPLGLKEVCIDSVARIAALAAADGRAEPAARLLAAAETLGHELGYTFEQPEQDRYRRASNDARAFLGPERFTATWTEGQSLSLDAALAEATALATSLHTLGAEVSTGQRLARAENEPSLSPREVEVLRLLAEGRSDLEIGATLSIARRTASKHVSSILDKLRVSTRAAAVSYAVRHGLI